MADTLVLQSHRSPLPYPWLDQCLQSVKLWSTQNLYDYEFIGDELFAPLSKLILEKIQHQIVIASDLARLIALQKYLKQGYQTVIWCDADFLIFDPENFIIPQTSYAVGREVWVQNDKNNKLKAYRKVHNAFLMFRQGNSFLDFYCDNALHLLELNTGTMPPQFIGPKLLTALHNIVQCPVMEAAGMLSPLVIEDIRKGSGPALDLFKKSSNQKISGANLCSSLVPADREHDKQIYQLIEVLLKSEQSHVTKS